MLKMKRHVKSVYYNYITSLMLCFRKSEYSTLECSVLVKLELKFLCKIFRNHRYYQCGICLHVQSLKKLYCQTLAIPVPIPVRKFCQFLYITYVKSPAFQRVIDTFSLVLVMRYKFLHNFIETQLHQNSVNTVAGNCICIKCHYDCTPFIVNLYICDYINVGNNKT